jgi:hypothetical protein
MSGERVFIAGAAGKIEVVIDRPTGKGRRGG